MRIFQDWLITFYKMIVSPLPATFISESKKAKDKFVSSVVWLEISVLFIHVYLYLAYQYVYPTFGIILSFLYIPILFLFYVYSIDFLYKRLLNRKKDYYYELLYLIVSISFPFFVINSFTLLIPDKLGIILSWATITYPFLLIILALKSLAKLKFWQAFIVVLLATVLAAGGLFCIPAFILSMISSVPGVIF